jgi:AhpD family alkylhydroperoxidase
MQDGIVPREVMMKTGYKRKFSVAQMYRSIMLVPRTVPYVRYNRKHKLVPSDLIERLMLAVTEVNGCAACSYAHARMALAQGMGSDEIHSFLSGDGTFVKPQEAKAILFAQHFADTGGNPDDEAYAVLEQSYGKKEALIMLSAVRMIQLGNIYGIPFSSFIARLRGRAYRDSSILYEVGMLLSGIVLLPVALMHGLLCRRI